MYEDMIFKMLSDAAITAFKDLQNEDNYEVVHIQADEILCRLLYATGFSRVVDEYKKINRWYA